MLSVKEWEGSESDRPTDSPFEFHKGRPHLFQPETFTFSKPANWENSRQSPAPSLPHVRPSARGLSVMEAQPRGQVTRTGWTTVVASLT